MSPADLKPFYAVLRKLSFKRTYRATQAQPCHCYERETTYKGKRILVDVQLWTDGMHRTSHMHPHISDAPGIMDSSPSEFRTPTGMVAAIEFETTRFVDGVDRKISKGFR